MDTIRVNFVDFWPGFDKRKVNFLLDVLLGRYSVIIDEENPEILFFANYGTDYLKYNCTRVFYSAENQRPDFSACDYAITFDYLNDKRHYRLPLNVLYYLGHVRDLSLPPLTQVPDRRQATEIWRNKKKFCCIVVSNPNAKKRINFFQKLHHIKPVDSGGRAFNNIGGPIGGGSKEKLDFLSQYRFVIAFENSAWPGYTTEKIVEPFFSHTIPIYWGNPLINKDYNKGRFINYDDFATEDALIDKILEIDANEELAIEMLTNPVFNGNQLPPEYELDNLLRFLTGIVQQSRHGQPVSARLPTRMAHSIKRKTSMLKSYFDKLTGKNFR